jgi:choline dehydrogenase-like flavoprotein
VRAAQEAGIVYNPDFNDGNPHGTGFMQMTNRAGRRCSAVDAFIRPLAGDSRLTVKTEPRVKRIISSGNEAVGIEYEQLGSIHRVDPVQSQPALEEHTRRTVKTNYHPVGTCRMGRADDRMAVVTPDMRVRGVERLRVIDLSVVPQLRTGARISESSARGGCGGLVGIERSAGPRAGKVGALNSRLSLCRRIRERAGDGNRRSRGRFSPSQR